MNKIFAAVVALGLASGVAHASTPYTGLNDSAPRSADIFTDIQRTAPRTSFAEINDTAPKSVFDDIQNSAPRSLDGSGDAR